MSSTAVKRLFIAAAATAAIGSTGAAFAAKPDAESIVVAKLYKDFAWQAMATQNDLFGADLAHQKRATLEKYFVPSLADLLIKDATCQIKTEGICNLDSDVLFDSQDPRVTDLEIATVAPGKVSVVFNDPVTDKKTRIVFDVSRIRGAWKINNIVYTTSEKRSLRQVLSHTIQ